MSKAEKDKPIKIPLPYTDTLKAFLETPPKRRKKLKKKAGKRT